MEQLLGGFGGGGTSISPDNSLHSSSSGTFGDHTIGLGGGKNSLLWIIGGVLLAVILWKKL